jgi:hypothetical protein
MKHLFLLFLAVLLLTARTAYSQVVPDTARPTAPPPPIKVTLPEPPRKWFERINLRGYIQVRYNRLLETNPDLRCEQCDRSWGRDGGLSIRRARLILSGNLHERVYFYFQPDFASTASSTSLHFGQLRDAYFDLALDDSLEFRIRLGQSKIPYGFENMQSSQNRLTLDRSDPVNSSLPNERDLGAFLYWAPARIRDRFDALTASGLKGSGDYGVAGFGVFNGQGANRLDENNSLHVVGRLSYPLKLKGGQFVEPGIQAYSGRYVVTKAQLSPSMTAARYYTDERVAASLMVYPQPLGFQAEYNIGRGPEFNSETRQIEARPLEGGYAMLMYRFVSDKQVVIPFVRAQYYKGGKKFETDARRYRMRELEAGIEWQPVTAFELTAQYTLSDRRFEDFMLPDNHQRGGLLRLQAQVNY